MRQCCAFECAPFVVHHNSYIILTSFLQVAMQRHLAGLLCLLVGAQVHLVWQEP